jgi:hypothetical protein
LAAGGEIPDFAFGGDGYFGIHPSPYFNIIGGYGGAFSADPYNTFRTDDRGLTLKLKSVFEQGRSSDVNLVDATQFITAYGRAGLLYYSLGWAGTPGTLPTSPGIATARLVVDPTDNVSIGTFGVGGRRSASADTTAGPQAATSLWRAGVDVNATVADFTTQAVFMAAGDLVGKQAQDFGLGGYVELMYALRLEGRPVFFPLARVDWLQRDGGNVVSGTADISSYVFENARVGGEVSYQQPFGVNEPTVTAGSLYVDLAF